MILHANTLPPGAPSAPPPPPPHPHTHTELEYYLKPSWKQEHFIHGQEFSQTCWHSHGNQRCPCNTNLFMFCCKKKHLGSLSLGNPLLKDIYRWHLLDLPRHYKSTPIYEGFHEQTPLHDQSPFEHSTLETSFLEMKIHIGAGHKLTTTLPRKLTDCAALLHFHSTSHSNAKKALFSHKSLNTTFSLQIRSRYKKNWILSEYLFLPENTL